MSNTINDLNNCLRYLNSSQEARGTQEIKKLSTPLKNKLHEAFWIVSGRPSGDPCFGKRIEHVTGDCKKKADAIKYVIARRPDLLLDMTSKRECQRIPAEVQLKPKKNLENCLSYLNSSQEVRGTEEIRKLSPELKDSLHEAFWIVSGRPSGDPFFGQRIEQVTGDCRKKAEAIRYVIDNRPDLLSERTSTQAYKGRAEVSSLQQSLSLADFPRVTCHEEHLLKELTDCLLNNRASEANHRFQQLPRHLQTEISKHLQKNVENCKGKNFLDRDVDNQIKASVVIDFVRNKFIPQQEQFMRRVSELNDWTGTIGYEESSTISRSKENRKVTQWDLFPYDSTLIKLSDDRFVNANLVFDKYVLTQTPVSTRSKTDSPHDTLEVFWQLVEDTQVETIVMLNGEEGAEYLPYFPGEQNDVVRMSDRVVIGAEHKVHFVEEFNPKNNQTVSERTIYLQKRDGTLKTIKHIKANNWRDFTAGQERTISKILDLIDEAQASKDTPLLVNCKGGVGRTGQLVSIHHLKEQAKRGEEVDVVETVRQLRDPMTGRTPVMVQKDEQLIFAHRFLLNLAPKG